MISEKKVSLMTKLAIFEQNKDASLNRATHYFRGDFIGIHLLKNTFWITLAFLAGLILWGCYYLDELLLKVNTMDIYDVGKRILFAYIVTLAVYLALSYIVFSFKYYSAEYEFRRYHQMLSQLLKEYDREAGIEPEEETGRRKGRKERKSGGSPHADRTWN